jgi:hypothetical protein
MRAIGLLLAASAFSVLVAACGGRTTSSSPAPSASAPPSSAPPPTAPPPSSAPSPTPSSTPSSTPPSSGPEPGPQQPACPEDLNAALGTACQASDQTCSACDAGTTAGCAVIVCVGGSWAAEGSSSGPMPEAGVACPAMWEEAVQTLCDQPCGPLGAGCSYPGEGDGEPDGGAATAAATCVAISGPPENDAGLPGTWICLQ